MKGVSNIQFEFYVLNYNHNKQKVEMFNIFNNIRVQEWTEKAIKKYLRNPKKFAFTPYNKNEEVIYGFDGFVKELDRIIMCEEWSRSEYEVGVGHAFTTEIRDVIREIERGNLAVENIYDELKIIEQRNSKLEKVDCYVQASKNIEMIAREVIFQYKQQKKKGSD